MWSGSEHMARSWDKNLGQRERRYHHVRPPLIIGLAPGRPVGLTLRMLGVIAARGVLQYILVSLGCGEGYGCCTICTAERASLTKRVQCLVEDREPL